MDWTVPLDAPLTTLYGGTSLKGAANASKGNGRHKSQFKGVEEGTLDPSGELVRVEAQVCGELCVRQSLTLR